MKAKFLLLPAVLLVTFFSYLGMYCGIDTNCALAPYLSSFSFTLLKPLWVFGLFSLPVYMVLIFVRNSAWKAWLQFSSWWLPLSVIVIAITPTWSSSWFSFFSIVKEDSAIIMASLFTIISLILISWKQFSLGKGQGR